MIPERPDFVVFAMTTVCERSHDLGLVWDPSGVPARINHVAYFVDSREELLRVADVLLNADVAIEFGPGKHGMGEQDYLYIREPGGMRVEINAGGYRNYEPDWETVRYEPQQGSNVFYKNLGLPHSMFESFPPVEMTAREGGGDEGRDRAVQLTGVERVLVVGGGIGGLSSTIALRRAGVEVDVVEINPKWDVYGVGIIQPGNAIRALDQLGLAEQAIAEGFAIQGSRFRDGEGNVLGEVPAPPLLGDRYPRHERDHAAAAAPHLPGRGAGVRRRGAARCDRRRPRAGRRRGRRHVHGRQQRPLRPRDRRRRDQLARPRPRLPETRRSPSTRARSSGATTSRSPRSRTRSTRSSACAARRGSCRSHPT